MVAASYSPLPYTTPDELWQTALSELCGQMTKATFNAWLADSRVLTAISTLQTLVIVVRNQYAQEWLTHRLSPVIVRTLAFIAGSRIELHFVSINYAKDIVVRSLREQIHDDACRRSEQILAHYSYEPKFPSSRKGEDVMTNQPHTSRIRIYSHIIQSRFLHVEDALAIDKLRLFAGNYRKGHGMNSYAHAYVDIADARIIFAALARGEQGFRHKEYKGTPARKNRAAISRVLSVVVQGENVYMELKSGPGKMTDTGAILPNGRSTVEVNVGFKLYEARRMAASVLAYIHAWDMMRMMIHQQMVSQPPPYTFTPLSTSSLASATRTANGIQGKPGASSKRPLANGAPTPNGAIRTPVVTANGSPVTCKDPAPEPTSANTPTTLADAQSANSETAVSMRQLQYGDGRLVDMQNLTEVQTFQRYVAEKDGEPKSKGVLLAYYQQRVRVAAASSVAG